MLNSGLAAIAKPAKTRAGIRGSAKVVNPTANTMGIVVANISSSGAPSRAIAMTTVAHVTAARYGLASSASSGERGRMSSNHPEGVDKLTSPLRMSLAARMTTTTSRSTRVILPPGNRRAWSTHPCDRCAMDKV